MRHRSVCEKLTRCLALREQLYGPGYLQAPDSLPSVLSGHLRQRQEMQAAQLDDGQAGALVLTMAQKLPERNRLVFWLSSRGLCRVRIAPRLCQVRGMSHNLLLLGRGNVRLTKTVLVTQIRSLDRSPTPFGLAIVRSQFFWLPDLIKRHSLGPGG